MLDLARILQPVSAHQPCGEDLSFSPEVDAIARAREFDDPSLDQGEWATDLKEADWGFVIERCGELIGTRSKDLRLAVWMGEALAKVRHFRGLGEGYALLAGLCEQYWDGLYPVAEDGDQEQRIGNLSWLLIRSPQLVREIPLTAGEHTAFSTVDFEAARLHAAEVERQGSEARPATGPTLAEVEAARQKTPRSFYASLMDDAQFCLESLCDLEKAVDARLGLEGPGFSAAREAIEQAIRFFGPLVGAPLPDVLPVTGNSSAIVESSAVNDAAQISQFAGPIQTRAQAIQQLKQVAEFFRRTEPHSPVAHLAEKAAAWGNLPLHDWLRQVVKDQGSLAHIEELLGLGASEGR